MTEALPEHSPLGASGAERWMNCPGSVNLLKRLGMVETSDEPDYRRNGTAAHEAANHCLVRKLDAWEVVGMTFHGTEVSVEMADTLQVYLDECRSHIGPDAKTYFEARFHAPELHPDCFGTTDFGAVNGNTLVIRDFKYGEGIAVEIDFNPQVKYYAYGLLREHPEVEIVDLGIVQPRIAYLEPVRTWQTSAVSIRQWAETELKPAMELTAVDHSLDAGPWCRFCPAKLVCPLMHSLFGAAMQTNTQVVINVTNEILGRNYQYLEALGFFVKAMKEETFRRLNKGDDVPHTKLVYKKANRVHKEGAVGVYIEAFGQEAYTEPTLKTPAQIDALGPKGKQLTREWAYTPKSGLTVALASDKRAGVKVQTTTEAFPNAAALGAEPEET